MPLILGSRSTIPGFEDGLINAVPGQDVILNVTFPDNYGAKELAGKAAQFATKVNKVEAPKLPELDDAFAKIFGIEEGGVEKLQEEVKQTLESQLAQALHRKLKAEVMTKLGESYKTMEVPKALVRQEAEQLAEQAKQQFKQEFNADVFMERAKDRVILGLVINEIIHHDNIKADPDRVRKIIEEMAERFDHPEQVVSWYYQQKEKLAEIQSLAIEDQIVDKIISAATIVEKPAAATDVLNMEGVR
jgi:trigger factor